MSQGADNLLTLLHQAFGERAIILSEYNVGQNLFLDFYIPSLRLGFEYHGRQHREYVEHFHGNAAGFTASKLRDATKIQLCRDQGIGIVVFWLDEEISVARILELSEEALALVRDIDPGPSKKDLQKAEYNRRNRERYQELKQRYAKKD